MGVACAPRTLARPRGCASTWAARNDEDNDPDDPGALAAAAPLYLCALCPPDATVDDLDWGADGGAAPQVVAGQLDAELARVRLRLVHGKESESRTPCPICGDRYPARHLLTNSPSAHAVCPACVFDGDQHYRTDLPHLAVQLDRLAGEDLSASCWWTPWPPCWRCAAARIWVPAWSARSATAAAFRC